MSLSEMNSSLFVRVILAMGAHDWTSHSSFGLWSGRSESNHIEILSRLRSKRKSSGFKIALHPFEDCCSNFVFELPSFRVAVTTSIDNLAPFDVAPRLPWLELEDHWHLRTSQSTELGSASVSSSSEVAPVGASSSSWFLSIPPTSIKAALVVGSGSVERLQDIRGPRTGCFSVLQRALPLDRCSSVLSCCAASSWHALGSACASQSHLVPSNQSEVRPDTLPATCILKSCLHALAFLVSSIQWITLSSHKAVCLGLLHRCWPIACPSVSKTNCCSCKHHSWEDRQEQAKANPEAFTWVWFIAGLLLSACNCGLKTHHDWQPENCLCQFAQASAVCGLLLHLDHLSFSNWLLGLNVKHSSITHECKETLSCQRFRSNVTQVEQWWTWPKFLLLVLDCIQSIFPLKCLPTSLSRKQLFAELLSAY